MYAIGLENWPFIPRYISDVAAYGLKPLFITGCVITGVFFDLAFISERWLRHSGRLARNKGRADKIFAILAIIFAIFGAVGLILLSIFDTVRHSHAHNGFLVMFMWVLIRFRTDRPLRPYYTSSNMSIMKNRGGYLLSAIFVCAEYQRLGIHYREHRILTISFWVKLAFIIVELSLAIAFGVLGRGWRKNQAAVVEWGAYNHILTYLPTYLLCLPLEACWNRLTLHI